MAEIPPDTKQSTQEHAAPAGPPPGYDARPLPAGWIKEFDPNTNRHFYVDTLAQPPHAIWVHPFDDPDFLALHEGSEGRPATPSYDEAPPIGDVKRPIGKDEKRRDSSQHDHPDRKEHLAVPSERPTSASSSSSSSAAKGKGKERGFFGKLKDKAIGTKEEREAAAKAREIRRREEERIYIAHREAMLAQREAMLREQAAYYNQQSNFYGQQQQQGYGPPMQSAYGGPQYQGGQYGASPYRQNPYVVQQAPRRGGGSSALPILGGLAGGLLLGDLLF